MVECEEFHRQFVASLNGQAGIAVIEQDWTTAVDKYREVLQAAEQYKAKIKTDTLQRLHTVTNLAEILESNHEGIAPTLRDGKLREDATELRERYLSKYITALAASKVSQHLKLCGIQILSFCCLLGCREPGDQAG